MNLISPYEQGFESIQQQFEGFRMLRKMDPNHQMLPTLAEWVDKHGRAMRGERVELDPQEIKAGNKECFLNAWLYKTANLANDHLRYCEGYAFIERCPIPVLHGWLVTPAGHIIDPTVENDRRAAYYGVAFQDRFMERVWPKLHKKGLIGILGNLYALDIKLSELEASLCNVENSANA